LHRIAIAIGKKWNIIVNETFAWFPTTGETDAENVDHRGDRAADDGSVCADQHEVPGFFRVRPGTQDAEEQDFDRAGCVEIRAGTSAEDCEGRIGKRARQADDNRNGYEEEVLVLQQRGPALMPGRFARVCPMVRSCTRFSRHW